MFSSSAKHSVTGFVSTISQLLLCFSMVFSGVVIADWNSGITIEDVSTRIAINVVDDGVQVSVDLAESGIARLHEDKTDDSKEVMTLDEFAKVVIKIQGLSPVIKPPINNESAKADLSANKEVFFPFSNGRPKQLHIIPVFNIIEKAGDKSLVTVSHQGLPVIDHGVLTGAETLSLDWQDPWYSHFLNPKLKRGHTDPLMAFLYIEPQQIKSEIVVRVKEMANWTDLGLRDNKIIHPDEFASVKQKIGRFLLAQNKVSADTKALSPRLERVDYIRMGAADIQAYEPQQAQRQVATLIGVSIIHKTKGLPEKVQWQWNLFNEKIQRVAIRAYDPAGLFDSYVTPGYSVFEWENMLADIDLPELADKPQSIPVTVKNDQGLKQYYWLAGVFGFLVLSLVSSKFISLQFRKYIHVAIALIIIVTGFYFWKSGNLRFGMEQVGLDKQQARPVLQQLLWNVYQAFESAQEDATYDQLAYSVSGNLRETLYLQNRQALLLEDGGWSKVKKIEIQSLVDRSDLLSDGHLFDCEWLVFGEVIHWGHQHRRENVYRANIKIAPIEGTWKIVELESISQQRVDGSEPL
jgi:hypothetical protein